jgi:hypothetical protein
MVAGLRARLAQLKLKGQGRIQETFVYERMELRSQQNDNGAVEPTASMNYKKK